jgi:hypothetical protein
MRRTEIAPVGHIDEWHLLFRKWFSKNGIGEIWPSWL